MSADTSGTPRPSRTGTIILILLVVIMGSGLGFFAYKYYASQSDLETKETHIEELTGEIEDLEVELENYQLELDETNVQLEERERLLAEKEQLLVEKQKKIDQLLKDGKISKEKAANLQNRVETLEHYIKQYQTKIDELQTQVAALTQTKDSLTGKIDTMAGKMHDLDMAKTQSDLIVAAASVLKAASFKYYRVKSSGKEVNVTDEPLNKGSIEKLKICFDLIENPAAKPGQRDVFIAIIDPKGNVIKDMDKQSGYTTVEGKETAYSIKQSVNYDRTTMNICVVFSQPSEYQYAAGKHTVKVYTDKYHISTSSFDVK